jgi:gamma-glutamyltranspeptidase/glutathione hydrolase
VKPLDNSKIRAFLVAALGTLLLLGSLALNAATSHPVYGRQGVVSTASAVASEVGLDVLKSGGNAVDAAIATAFAMAVTWPSAGNIGGGGFLVYHGANGENTAFDFREKAPLAATRTMYLDEDGSIRDNSNHDSLLAVGVPGTVAGMELAHRRFGSLEWADLLQPAIDLAREGFALSWHLEESFRSNKEWWDR